MAITSHPVNSGTTSTLSPSLPFGFTANAGELIICLAGSDSPVTSHTYGGSWVEPIAETTPSGARGSAAYLIAAGGETTDELTGGGTADRWECVYVRFPVGEWHGTTPPEFLASSAGTNANPDPPSLSPSWGNEPGTIFIAGYVSDDSAAPTTNAYPTNYGTAQNTSAGTTSSANVGVAVRNDGAHGHPENPGTFTLSTADGWVAYTIAVRGPTVAARRRKLLTLGVSTLFIPARTILLPSRRLVAG